MKGDILAEGHNVWMTTNRGPHSEAAGKPTRPIQHAGGMATRPYVTAFHRAAVVMQEMNVPGAMYGARRTPPLVTEHEWQQSPRA